MVEEVMVRSKELFYRGKSLEQLKALDVRESAKYLPCRSRRSVLRHFDVIEKFLKRCEASNAQNKKIKTHLRDIVIVPKMVGFIIQVHNGKTYNEVRISNNMIGHRLGEFSLTRQRVNHGSPGIGATKSSSGDKK
jgi:small subunit ribosomal protein S19